MTVQSGKHGRAGSRALCELARGQKRVWGASGENMVKGVYIAGKWRGKGNRERVNDRSFIPENEDGRVSLSAPKSGVGEPLRIR